jgi:hypothetical protein
MNTEKNVRPATPKWTGSTGGATIDREAKDEVIIQQDTENKAILLL